MKFRPLLMAVSVKCLKCVSQNMEYTPQLTSAEAAVLLYKIMKQKMNNFTILRRNLVWI